MAIIRSIKIMCILFMVVSFGFVAFEYTRQYGYEMAARAVSPSPAGAQRSTIRTTSVGPVPQEKCSEAVCKPWAVAKRFSQRFRHLKQECQRNHYPPPMEDWVSSHNFLVDIPRRLLVCAVPKAGITTWHRTVWAIRRIREGKSTDQSLYTGKDTAYNTFLANNVPRIDGLKLIRPVAGDAIFWKEPPPDSTFRLILARHPFARLLSGWNQKFLLQSNYWVHLFKTYKDLLGYRKHYDEKHVMAFRDFAHYVADKGSNLRALDFHFQPAHVFCRPCNYHYTYILKAESIDIDESWLMNRLNLSDLNVGRKGMPPGGSVVNEDVKGNIKKYMSQLTPQVVKQLYKIYARDFSFFGYTFNFTTLEAGGFE